MDRDCNVGLNAIELEMLLAALDVYEPKVRKKRSDSNLKAIAAVRRKLTIASQRHGQAAGDHDSE